MLRDALPHIIGPHGVRSPDGRKGLPTAAVPINPHRSPRYLRLYSVSAIVNQIPTDDPPSHVFEYKSNNPAWSLASQYPWTLSHCNLQALFCFIVSFSFLLETIPNTHHKS